MVGVGGFTKCSVDYRRAKLINVLLTTPFFVAWPSGLATRIGSLFEERWKHIYHLADSQHSRMGSRGSQTTASTRCQVHNCCTEPGQMHKKIYVVLLQTVVVLRPNPRVQSPRLTASPRHPRRNPQPAALWSYFTLCTLPWSHLYSIYVSLHRVLGRPNLVSSGALVGGTSTQGIPLS